jgi:murein DD-endopeptidase MepM/ murein hydrolase activator NlpD
MRWWIVLVAVSGFGQSFSYEPARPAQGDALKVYASGPAESARLKSKTIHLFAQPDGRALGLMPTGVLTKPGVYKLEWLNAKGIVLHEEEVTIRDARFKKQNVVLSKALSNLHSTSDERERVTAFLKTVSPERYWMEPLEAPLPGCTTSPFGVTRLHNGKPTGDYHAGLDQRGAMGSPVHAVAAGVVRISQPFTLRGGTVALDHGQGLESIYLHMSRLEAKEGEHVKAGDVVGYVGSTGRSTGPHLHWTLYANGEPVNPRQWVRLKACPTEALKPRPRRHTPSS